MTTKIYLTVVEPEEGDSTIMWDGPKGQPMLVGDEPDESYACGKCRSVLLKHISTKSLYSQFSTPKRLVFQCGCGAHNLVPSKQVPKA